MGGVANWLHNNDELTPTAHQEKKQNHNKMAITPASSLLAEYDVILWRRRQATGTAAD
jgi:hypothetical protein